MKNIYETDPVTKIPIWFVVTKGLNDMSKKRATSMWRKEPGTIEWLRGMKEGDQLLDIGANVGVYTLFASVVMGCSVVALEPESLNFARLNQNIRANDVSRTVTAYPFAASDHSGAGILNVGRMIVGHSGHQHHRRTPDKPQHLQGTWKSSVDNLRIQPSHIKIDIDGDEPMVIEGMHHTLEDSAVREIQVEIDTASQSHRLIQTHLGVYGFMKYDEEIARTEGMENWRWRRI